MGVISDLPNRPLRPAEVERIKEHPKIESSVSVDRPPMGGQEGGVITMVMLVGGNAVGMTLEESGWGKLVLERDISEEEFVAKASGLAETL